MVYVCSHGNPQPSPAGQHPAQRAAAAARSRRRRCTCSRCVNQRQGVVLRHGAHVMQRFMQCTLCLAAGRVRCELTPPTWWWRRRQLAAGSINRHAGVCARNVQMPARGIRAAPGAGPHPQRARSCDASSSQLVAERRSRERQGSSALLNWSLLQRACTPRERAAAAARADTCARRRRRPPVDSTAAHAQQQTERPMENTHSIQQHALVHWQGQRPGHPAPRAAHGASAWRARGNMACTHGMHTTTTALHTHELDNYAQPCPAPHMTATKQQQARGRHAGGAGARW